MLPIAPDFTPFWNSREEFQKGGAYCPSHICLRIPFPLQDDCCSSLILIPSSSGSECSSHSASLIWCSQARLRATWSSSVCLIWIPDLEPDRCISDLIWSVEFFALCFGFLFNNCSYILWVTFFFLTLHCTHTNQK